MVKKCKWGLLVLIGLAGGIAGPMVTLGANERADRKPPASAPATATSPAKGVPLGDLVVYPDKWAATAPAGTNLESAPNKAVLQKLRAPLGELKEDSPGLERVIYFFSDRAAMNVMVDWNALEKAGVKRETIVPVKWPDSTIRETLAATLAKLDNEKANLACAIIDGIVVVSTKQNIADRLAHNGPAVPMADGPANRKAAEAFEQNVKEIAVDGVGLEKVVNFFHDSLKIEIQVNWLALEEAGVDKDSGVTVSLKQVPYRVALINILDSVKIKDSLGYAIQDGVIVISTRKDFEAKGATRP